jgi:hypothetical protein
MSRFITAIVTIATLVSLAPTAHAQTAPAKLQATSTGAEALQGLEARNFEFRNPPAEIRTDPYVQPTDAALNRSTTLLPLDAQTDLVLRVQNDPISPGVFPPNELRDYEQLQVLFQVQ